MPTPVTRPSIVITHEQWIELQKMHSPTTVVSGYIRTSGPCAVCKDPGEGGWCATYQWLVKIATQGHRVAAPEPQPEG